ncbi:MAG: VPLPA-CTERM-specific exosortase XrtD [Gammaproteobacteria bacterium]
MYAAVLALGIVVLLFTFRSGLKEMERVWGTPEYSYAYLIPFLSFYVLAIRLGALRAAGYAESWAGVWVVAVGLLAFAFGELSAIYAIVQYAFLLMLWGLVITVIGVSGTRVIWAALAFLIFLVPLPNFIQISLSSGLQLVSSELGTLMIRLMGLPVFLEGNVIDLGTYKLQVVEACNGLRYLFPLMSFGFLCAVVFRGPVWQRWLIFLSSVPITIVMNSFRIAVTGVLVNRWGTQAAEGFLHYFEGWVIFSACLLLMFGEMALLAKVAGKPLIEVFDVDLPPMSDFQGWFAGRSLGGPVIAALLLLVGGAVISVLLAGRQEKVPEHVSLGTFPLSVGEWRGTERQIGDAELDVLKLTDYTMIGYSSARDASSVELYVAYYDSQRKGTSAHSPRACLPGSGWRFDEFDQVSLPDVQADGAPIPVNRVLMSMGEERLLVYYWFMQRGRNVTSEYAAKWYIFWDSVTRQRTDGALVRVITSVDDASRVPEADARLTGFLREVYPTLYYHIPQADAVPRRSSPADVLGPSSASP